MSEITKAALQASVKAGEPIIKLLDEMTKDPMRTQREFLKKLLNDNKDTEYGKKYNFAAIDSIESYRKNVPLSNYDTYAPYIERMSQNDIQNGTIDPSIDMPSDVRATIEASITPMPERAKELRDIFEQGFGEPFIPKVWPNMQYFSGAATGTFKEYWKKCSERYAGPTISIFARGVAASEGIFRGV